MNIIKKSPLSALGYDFIPSNFLPKGKDEYYLRNKQNKSGISYRHLTAYEIEVLVRNRNQSDDWNKLLVSDAFNPELVKNCKFFGLVRIGKLEPYCIEFNNLRMPVGLYNSTIISCDFGDNVVIDNVNYLSHYIIGSEVILVNINELATTNHSKFGNGILKEGEQENIRIWLEVCNENGGRKILPFDGMLPGDAYLWTRHRQDTELQQRFVEFTQERFDSRRGYYGNIGDRTVIKNSRIIKDVWIGSDAYIKGANKLKNLTINSNPDAKTQIGEGCELVNGIIGIGCRLFYGVKAVRFFMASHSQLKYGARLINSYLGNNATISCCEVLNSLIFPAHEQHHNNSFLCAALVMGQSNMAAGATIGSNHNSRGADGELIAGRGFWPGLCVSLKHNSRFATYSILAKGDFPAELNISLPFSLISNDVTNDRLVIMPAYWFQYNMYALARNSWKYIDRDKRTDKTQMIEYDYLAPDSVNEIVEALQLIAKAAGKAWYSASKQIIPGEESVIAKGRELLEDDNPELRTLTILLDKAENSQRPAVIIKAGMAYQWYHKLIRYYTAREILLFAQQNKITTLSGIKSALPKAGARKPFENIGGQLIEKSVIEHCLQQVKQGKIRNWEQLHQFYQKQGEQYHSAKFHHALATFKEVYGIDLSGSASELVDLLKESTAIRQQLSDNIVSSRKKDYQNTFRKMVYDNDQEMEIVIGKLEDNGFIQEDQKANQQYKRAINALLKK